MFRMKTCFCNICSVRIGSLIILWSTLMFNVYFTVGGLIEFIQKNYEVSYYLSYILQTWAMIELAFIIHALIGVKKKQPSYIYIYFVVSKVKTALTMLSDIFLLGLMLFAKHMVAEWVIHHSDNVDIDRETLEEWMNVIVVVLFVIIVIYFGILFYFSAIIYSYYKDLKEEQEKGNTGISGTTLLNCSSDPSKSPEDIDTYA